jgi:hypothetical protein
MMADDSFHNYYEGVVLECLVDVVRRDPTLTEDNLADVACIALNHLPPRYVRFDVDMSFYLTTQEREEINLRTREAISSAIETVKSDNDRRQDQP